MASVTACGVTNVVLELAGKPQRRYPAPGYGKMPSSEGRHRQQAAAPLAKRDENTVARSNDQHKAGYAISFESWEAYQRWEDEQTAKTPDGPDAAVRRFWEMADLTDSLERLNPHERPRFTASFESFDEYETWKNGQTNPWNW